MAKKNQIDQEASDAIYYIQKEAELRKEISSSFDSYIENVKHYSNLQKKYNQSLDLQKKTEDKISEIKAKQAANNNIITSEQQEQLDLEKAKLEILKKQNKKLDD